MQSKIKNQKSKNRRPGPSDKKLSAFAAETSLTW
jgi:hypothetical protein